MDQALSLGFALDAAPGSWSAARKKGDRAAVKTAVDRSIELAEIADQAGIESIWNLEDPDGWDAFQVLSAMARVTERVRLGTGVTNPYYRHPALLAAAISTLDHLSGGRAFLGLGRGQEEWYEKALGIPVGKPVRALRETIDMLRQWWSPEMTASSPDGATEFNVNAWERVIRPLQDHLPIYLAAVGPLALHVAGDLADGVIFNDLASMEFLEESVAVVRERASQAGRDPDSISFYARTAISITDDPEALYERRKSTVASIHTLPGMERLLASPNYDTEKIIADVRQAMNTMEILGEGGGFGDLRRGGDMAAAKRAIPAGLMSELVVAGTTSEVHKQLRRYEEIGVTHVFLAYQDNSVTTESLSQVLHDLRTG